MTSSRSFRASGHFSSLRGNRPSPSGGKRSPCSRSQGNLRSPTSSRAACAASASGFASTPTLSMLGTGNQLWADRYDRALVDILAVQDEVARSVAAAVSGRVEAANRDRVVRLSPARLQAYDLVLRAKALTLNYTRDDNAQALACAERAIELDPSSARAAAHAAWCHFYDYMACWRVNPRASLDRSFELVEARRGARRNR